LTTDRRYLLDTNVLSETRKRRMDANVSAFLERADSHSLYLSVLTLGELEREIEIKRQDDPDAADPIGEWLALSVRDFANNILPVDENVARIWGHLSVDRTRPVIDALIAATAIAHDLVLVSRNLKDFEGIDVETLDPWKSGAKSPNRRLT